MLSASKYSFYLGVLIFITGLLYSCAQIGSISGGLKDTLAPVMLYSEPVFADTSFNENKIKITFDEYFVLNNINDEFLSSPPLKKFPDIKTKKHSLIVKLSDTLKESVTYVFDFGNALADLNEGNIVHDYKFVFSTGSIVDSFSISGKLKNAFDMLVPEKTRVMVYHDNNDSIPYLSMPDYLSKVDTSGNFSIDFIKGGRYKIFALQDMNGNLMFDPLENIAFLDSLIIPQREIVTNIDSVKAGTILHDVNNPEYRDSLVNDTVIITEQHFTSPNNVFLYMFAEKQNKQRLADYAREIKQKFYLAFDIPITDDYQLRPLNFSVSKENYILEINPEKDSLIYWYNDSLIESIDTLMFELSFRTIDSLSNSIIETDTVYIEYHEKQDKEAWKKELKGADTTKKIDYLNFEYFLENGKLDLKQNLTFETETPLTKKDTSLITLYEIRDTNTIDTKEQAINRIIRVSENQMFIQFKRAIINKLDFEGFDFDKQNWYSLQEKLDSSSYYFIITDEELAKSDSLNFIVNYDNAFFLNQIQELKDTVNISITPQALKGKMREEDNIIELAFDKPLSNKIDLFSVDFPEIKNAFNLQKNNIGDSLKITVLNNEIRLIDTLKMSLKSLDYIKLNGDSVFYEQTITLIYNEKEQFLSYYERIKDDNFRFIFNKPVTENIQFTAQNFDSNKKWFTISKSENNDTLDFSITDETISNMDTLKLIINYTNIDRKNQKQEYSDSLVIIKMQKNTLKEISNSKKSLNTNKSPEIVHIYVPIEYELLKDSNYTRKYNIITDWKEETNYKISVDSMAFIGYFNHYNKYTDYEFSTRKLDYYAQINIKLTNLIPDFSVKKDTVSIDTISSDNSNIKNKITPFLINNTKELIGKANFIFQLIDEKGIIFREFQLKEDTELKIGYITPEKYILKLIYDKNSNGKWDTGDYLKNVQAERVLIFPKEMGITEGLEINMEWNVGEQLIKLMQEGE